MTMLSKKATGRTLLALWLLACLVVLVFAFVERRVEDADIVFAVLLMALTFPSGYVVTVVIGAVFKVLDDSFGVVV